MQLTDEEIDEAEALLNKLRDTTARDPRTEFRSACALMDNSQFLKAVEEQINTRKYGHGELRELWKMIAEAEFLALKSVHEQEEEK